MKSIGKAGRRGGMEAYHFASYVSNCRRGGACTAGSSQSVKEAASNQRQELGLAVDKINNRFGKNSVYIAAGHAARNSAEEKIAFTKVEMFRRGRSKMQR